MDLPEFLGAGVLLAQLRFYALCMAAGIALLVVRDYVVFLLARMFDRRY